MSQSFVVPALITATALLISLIFVFMIYLWQRIGALEKNNLSSDPIVDAKQKGAALLGFKGKEIWDALENPSKAPVNIDELRQRYSFTLSRHIEQIIDQGQMDKQAGREAVPESDAAIGGLKVTTENGWFAARPSGTEDIYKIYAESFKGEDHLNAILDEAQEIVNAALKG